MGTSGGRLGGVGDSVGEHVTFLFVDSLLRLRSCAGYGCGSRVSY
jgi:hypothetical protein